MLRLFLAEYMRVFLSIISHILHSIDYTYSTNNAMIRSFFDGWMIIVYVAGVDEVGRGPLAGPVVTAAVILGAPIDGLMDSKRLSPLQRSKLAIEIKRHALCYAYGRADVGEIDALNIHHATLLAMKRAIEALSIQPSKVLVDGLHVPLVAMPCEAIIQGDSLVPAISAASILAKVARDEEMIHMDTLYPGYGFAKHKGYPTAAHRLALSAQGISLIHRRSFGPVKALL